MLYIFRLIIHSEEKTNASTMPISSPRSRSDIEYKMYPSIPSCVNPLTKALPIAEMDGKVSELTIPDSVITCQPAITAMMKISCARILLNVCLFIVPV